MRHLSLHQVSLRVCLHVSAARALWTFVSCLPARLDTCASPPTWRGLKTMAIVKQRASLYCWWYNEAALRHVMFPLWPARLRLLTDNIWMWVVPLCSHHTDKMDFESHNVERMKYQNPTASSFSSPLILLSQCQLQSQLNFRPERSPPLWSAVPGEGLDTFSYGIEW